MSNMLSQEEIDALLKGESSINDDIEEDINLLPSQDLLTDLEKDALGEIGNISMGTAATTLFTLLRKKVLITTPKVSITNSYELSKLYTKPFVAVDVRYKIGLEGSNLLFLKSDDVKIITDLMMGGDGTNVDRELNEMDLSAICEAMNQMVGSSSTSLSEMFGKKIDIEPPVVEVMDLNNDKSDLNMIEENKSYVKISFNMVVEDVIDSEIMQIMPIEFAKELASNVLNPQSAERENSKRKDKNNKNHELNEININDPVRIEKDNVMNQEDIVNIKKVDFKSFDNVENHKYNEGLDLLNDIPIELTVQLGKTIRKISDILEYGPGTIIELDKLVGEPLEILANGKLIAKGEVVVIDDNFGVRITEIINNTKK